MYGSQFQAYANHGDTWVYATPAPATITAFGSGCAGASGIPVLDRAPHVLPWLGDTFRTQVSPVDPLSKLVLFATGVRNPAPMDLASYGMPGCNLYVDIAAVDTAVATGTAQWSLWLPNRPEFVGLRLAQQAFILEPGANAAGAVSSNSIEFVAGVR